MWYHGTRTNFRRGGLLLPRMEHGNQANLLEEHDDEDGEYVYLTPEWRVAAYFACGAVGDGKPRILLVRPWEIVLPDAATFGGADGLLFRTRGACTVVNSTVLSEARGKWLCETLATDVQRMREES